MDNKSYDEEDLTVAGWDGKDTMCEVIDCPECHGDGEVDCPDCGGRGHKGPDYMPRPCDGCDNSGKRTCPTCGRDKTMLQAPDGALYNMDGSLHKCPDPGGMRKYAYDLHRNLTWLRDMVDGYRTRQDKSPLYMFDACDRIAEYLKTHREPRGL